MANTGSSSKIVSSSYLYTTLQAFYTKIKTLLSGKSDTNHTHNYAGSSSVGGAATTALACTGNSATATKATQDSGGQQINTTYLKGLSVSGKTITYTKGDNTTGTITTQDTNTTYTAGNGITLTGTVLSNSGVRAVASGTANGTVSVNTNGTNADVTVKGLGSAAYTASTAYATSGHTHNYIPMTGSTDITGVIRTNNEIQSTSANAFRIANSKYGVILRNDGGNTYVLLTNENDTYGSWNALRPLTINNSTGKVLFSNGLEGELKGTASNADTLDGYHAGDFQKNINIHSKIDLKSGSFYDCILDKINEGFRGGKIELNNYSPSDTCNGNYWGFVDWTCNENKFAHLLFYSDRSEIIYVREISFNEQTDTSWKRIGDGCNSDSVDGYHVSSATGNYLRSINYGTSALTPGSSGLSTGSIYLQYE